MMSSLVKSLIACFSLLSLILVMIEVPFMLVFVIIRAYLESTCMPLLLEAMGELAK